MSAQVLGSLLSIETKSQWETKTPKPTQDDKADHYLLWSSSQVTLVFLHSHEFRKNIRAEKLDFWLFYATEFLELIQFFSTHQVPLNERPLHEQSA